MAQDMGHVIISIDGAGRVMLPKPIRDRFRLKPGTRLELEICGDHLILRPLEGSAAQEDQDGPLSQW